MEGLSQDFIRTILEVEEAATLLAVARREGSRAKAREGAARGRTCAQLVIEAAEILASLGEENEARALLKQGLGLDGPTALLQLAYARHCRLAGDLDEASRWLQGAMLRARPNAAMALALCEIEYARENYAAASDALALSVQLRWLDTDGLHDAYRRLMQAGHEMAAIVPAMMLHRRGGDTSELRRELAELLHTHAPYERLPDDVVDALELDVPMTAIGIAATAAHDMLLAGFDMPAIANRAAQQESSERWISEENLWDFLRQRVERGEPFSFVRMSDGEGRFIAAMHRSLFPWIDDKAATATLRQIWMNWFGQEVQSVDAECLRDLATSFEQAILNAGLLGRTSAAMYRHDERHAGYRAALDQWLVGRSMASDQYYTEAAYNLFLARRDRFLTRMFAGQPFIGAISPYEDFSMRLSNEVGAGRYRDYVIPGETRLGREQESANRGTHFPDVFGSLMKEIEVPFPGACFVVAGGLLGKIYCERIRQLGGIALDIGAVADGWMGYDTRGNGFDQAVPDRLPG